MHSLMIALKKLCKRVIRKMRLLANRVIKRLHCIIKLNSKVNHLWVKLFSLNLHLWTPLLRKTWLRELWILQSNHSQIKTKFKVKCLKYCQLIGKNNRRKRYNTLNALKAFTKLFQNLIRAMLLHFRMRVSIMSLK